MLNTNDSYDGILGLDFLNLISGNNAVAIDYSSGKISTFEPTENTNKKSVPIKNQEHIYCEVTYNSKTFKALIDSGGRLRFLFSIMTIRFFHSRIKISLVAHYMDNFQSLFRIQMNFKFLLAIKK